MKSGRVGITVEGMSFAAELRRILKETHPGLESPAAEADARIERLAEISPTYRQLLTRHPEYWVWLETPANRDETFRYSAYPAIWKQEFPGPYESLEARQHALQRFRRKMSLRIAFREVNELVPIRASLLELSHLADFILREAFEAVRGVWEARLGTPWDEDAERPARLCVLGLGKLGGKELNFCSDVDLIFFYQGEGYCRKEGRLTQTSNPEFYARMCRDYGAFLQGRSEHGFLYNVDLRLRPEGDSGPIVRSFAGMTNYYWAAGQTWERLAFIRARAVAGDATLGAELLEELNPFRYPRSVSPGLLQEIAGVKVRTEREVVGEEHLERDIKSGYGGIREIEFFVQSLQLLNGGKNPFLQTASSMDALDQLVRYGLVVDEDRVFLRGAYEFLRLVENRLQIREEAQGHELPAPGPDRERLARSLGFEPGAFEEKLAGIRERVRTLYRSLFSESSRETEIQEWTLFLGNKPAPQRVQEKMERWFGRSVDVSNRLRSFILGGSQHLVTREQVKLFLDVSGSFDTTLPLLARPLRTLERVGQFAERYGARKQFFKACIGSPQFFKALCLLFDRSTFIHELLCQHPGIMEELLHEAPRRQKTPAELGEELGHLPHGERFPRYLWLYVKAEQVRLAMADLLFDLGVEQLQANLTTLADAAVRAALREADPEGMLAVVALGKYGGRELSYGSDLDLIVLAPEDDLPGAVQRAQKFRKILDHQEPLGRTFEVDLRLRPHGDAGPMVTTLSALAAYHEAGAGGQTWERQMLTRARLVGGNVELEQGFEALLHKLLYHGAAGPETLKEIWKMRLRIQREKTKGVVPQERAFKAGPGGLIDVEFLAQMTQLHWGDRVPALRQTTTRQVLRAAREAGLWPAEVVDAVLVNYDYLRRLELLLRRDGNTSVSILPEGEREHHAVALWLGFSDWDSFYADYTRRLADVRFRVLELIGRVGVGA